MKLRDFIGSSKVVETTANTFRPVIVGCGTGHCGFAIVACGGSRGGCGFTIVACGGRTRGGCGGWLL